MSPRVASIMSAMDKVLEVAEAQRDHARLAWMEAIKLIVEHDGSEATSAMMIHADELRRIYILAQSRHEGMALIWAAAREIYEVTGAAEP